MEHKNKNYIRENTLSISWNTYNFETGNITLNTILNAVWGYDYYGEERTVDWQVKLLRGHLEECRDYIITLRGVGYKFEIK